MRIQVLISTMNRRSSDVLIKEMRVSGSYVMINQITELKLKPKDLITSERRFVSFREKGLSRSRNRAIANSNADVCVIADDDMYYEDNYEQIIAEAYANHPDADMIAFRVGNEDPHAKSKEIRDGRVNLISSMKLSSIRLTFKRDSIVKNDIIFNEKFGAGAEYYAGEENIFLADCLRRGLKIYYVSEKIATLRLNESSSWFRGYDEQYFKVKGLSYFYISKYLSPLLILLFAIRKRQIYSKSVDLMHAIKYMFSGITEGRPRKRVYMAGDFASNNGPANVNKNYAKWLKDEIYFSKSNTKVVRIMHFLSKVLFSDKVIVSGLSKFHLDIVRLSKILHKDVAYLMHGYNAVEYGENSISHGKDRLQIEEDILNECNMIVCVSEEFARILKHEKPFLATKIVFVNNGIDNSVIERREARESKNSYTILSVGGGMPRKNNLKVCEAIASLDEDISFVVIGHKSRYGSKISKYPFVSYYDELDHDAVIKKMTQADLYIQNSTFETFGLAVCEALSAGCNLLVSKKVGAVSVIKDLSDANLIKSPSDVKELARKIRNLSQKKSDPLSFADNAEWRFAAVRLIGVIKGGRHVH